ncbi:MAG: hypothetical protein PVJ60_09590 [Phycisphaerales bacterium]|jgi:hypothetical protein
MCSPGNAERRIKYILILILLVLIPFKVSCAIASEGGVRCSSVLKFSVGVVAAFSIHEGAHALVAELTDTHMDWELGNYNQPLGFTEHASNDTKGAAINSAGLLSQAIGSEIILQVDSIDKNDDFVRGMMAWNIVNPILYALDYWFLHISNQENGSGYQGDIQGIEHYANEPTAHAFALSMAAIAAFQGYRFLKTQSWAPDWLKGETHTLHFAPEPSGGFSITYRFTF